MTDLARRRCVLIAALGFALFDAPREIAEAPPVTTVKAWLGTWQGIGLVTVGMARQGYDLQLTRYDGEGWRATFFVTGREHSFTSSAACRTNQPPR